MTVDAVIFDWGGTLVPWASIDHLASWRAYTSAVHPDDHDAAARAAQALVEADAVLWARARAEHRAFHVRDVLDHAGVPWDDAGVAGYRGYWDAFTAFDPDAEPLLRALRSWGLRLGVLSSTQWPAAWHTEILSRDGVLDLFDGTVWSSDLDWTKPHPSAFEAAVAAVGATDPGRCVYVGDRLYDDVHGAAEAGLRTIFVPHTRFTAADHVVHADTEPDAVVERLADVADVVAKWRT